MNSGMLEKGIIHHHLSDYQARLFDSFRVT